MAVYPNQAEFSSTGNCLFLNAGNVTTAGFKFSDCAFITAERDASLRKGKLIRNDVVLTTRGTVGNTAYFGDSVPFDHIRINSGMVILRSQTPDLQPRYLYLFVRSALFHAQVSALRTGSAQPQLPIRDINRIEIPIPPPEEQRAIAHILGTLDDKIELNRRMNETLEAMARALFKSWFIDFLPVRAKAAARTQTGDPVRAKHALSNVEGADGRDPGLPKPLADLFPDSFEDSELGEIPAGWEVVNLNDVADINYGQNLPQTELLGCGIPVFGAAGVIGYYSEAMFKDPIVLVTSRGSGSGTVHETHGPSFVTNNSFSVIPKDGWFSRHYLKASLLNGDISSLVTGSAQPQLTITNFSYLKLVRPAERIVRKFHSFADSLWQKKNANQEESHTLAALRDTLLPRLLSGEIRLKDVQTVTEEVL